MSRLESWRRTLSQFRRRTHHHLLHSFYVATVVASVIHLLNSAYVPLELPVTTLLANVASVYVPNPPAELDVRRHLAVVEIDQGRFDGVYRRRSPLNRCQLAADLRHLLRNPQLEILAVDLDMSPVDPEAYQAAWARGECESVDGSGITQVSMVGQAKAAATAEICQCELESILTQPENQVRIVAIRPLTPTEGRTPGKAWDNPDDFPQLEFGDPRLQVRFGMVHDYRYPADGHAGADTIPFAELITRRLCAMPANGRNGVSPRFELPAGCKSVPRPKVTSGTAAGTHIDQPELKTTPISFFETRHLFNSGLPIGIDDPCLAGPRPYNPEARRAPCDIRGVVLGGSYGTVDRPLTAAGRRPGVQVHAAIAAQMRAETWHGWGFLADVLIGALCFGPLVHALWRRYFLQRVQATRRGGPPWRHPKVAYLWLLLLAVLYVLLLMILIVSSAEIYSRWAVWISPVPVALAMLAEAMVGGSVGVANHIIRDLHTTLHGEPDAAGADRRLAVMFGKLPQAVAVGLILWTMYKLTLGH